MPPSEEKEDLASAPLRVGAVDALVLALALAAMLWGLGAYGLYEPHEGHFGGVSREMLQSGHWITPHLNVAYELSTGPSELDVLRYIAGFDARLHPRLTFALDFLGRWRPNGTGIGDNLFDISPGLKVNVFQAFVFNTYFLVPLNRNEGLRPDFTWGLGLEYTFGADDL